MTRTATLICLFFVLVNAGNSSFFQLRFDHSDFWLERDKNGPTSREITIPVDVSNVTSAILTAQFAMNWGNDMGVKFNKGSYSYFPSAPRPAVRMESVTIPDDNSVVHHPREVEQKTVGVDARRSEIRYYSVRGSRMYTNSRGKGSHNSRIVVVGRTVHGKAGPSATCIRVW